MSRKLVIDDGRSQRELLVVGTMIVGRDPECEISSRDPRLSRKHAEFHVEGADVVVRDLQSRNGVRVNNEPIQERTLQPGDLVQVAHLSLRFVDDSATPTTEITVAEVRTAAMPIVLAAPVEYDRTRALPASENAAAAAARTAAMPVVVAPEVTDDRTRVLAVRPRGAAPPVATAPISVVPADVGEIVIREQAPAAHDEMAASADLGVQALTSLGWGRRVLGQGLLLALVVFLMTVIPIVAWQARVFGVSALQVWPVLLPPFAASAFAGVMVAGLIARTAVRGSERGR